MLSPVPATVVAVVGGEAVAIDAVSIEAPDADCGFGRV